MTFSLGMGSFFPPWKSSPFQNTCQWKISLRKRKKKLKNCYLMLFVLSSVPPLFTIAPPQLYYFISRRPSHLFPSTFSPTTFFFSLTTTKLLPSNINHYLPPQFSIFERPIFKQQPLFSLHNFFFKLFNFFGC